MSEQGVVVKAAPLCVLLIDEDPERARQVEEGLMSNAVVHTATATHGRVLLDLIARISPDVIIMDCNSPDRDTIESLRLVAQSNPKPIVMFVEEEGGDRMLDAIEAGVSAYVIDGLKPKRVQPLIDTAIARFRHMDGLRNELKKTKEDLAARKVIERAKDILAQLEDDHLDSAGRAKIAKQPTTRPKNLQLTLFATEEHPLINEIRGLDLENLTPLAAHKLLESWRESLD